MSAIPAFPAPIRRYLDRFVARRRRLRLARAGLLALALVLGCTLVMAWVDRFAALPAWARAVVLIMELTGAALLLARPLHEALRRRVDWVEASEQVEARNGALGQRLVTV